MTLKVVTWTETVTSRYGWVNGARWIDPERFTTI